MAALQDIKRRIRSVRSTRQITKAMQLVAASKLRHYSTAATAPEAYLRAAEAVLEHLGASGEASRHPLYAARPVKRALTIVIAGDRTLAGPYNSNVFRAFDRLETTLAVPQSVITIGRQASVRLARRDDLSELAAYRLEAGEGDQELAQPVLHQLTTLYEASKVDRVDIVYTKFYSSVRQEVMTEQLLPVVAVAATTSQPTTLEPTPTEVLDVATRRLLEARLFAAILGSRASEQAARMLAMMNASDNAKDLIDDYTLAYNNARQAAITQELAEITAGTKAIN